MRSPTVSPASNFQNAEIATFLTCPTLVRQDVPFTRRRSRITPDQRQSCGCRTQPKACACTSPYSGIAHELRDIPTDHLHVERGLQDDADGRAHLASAAADFAFPRRSRAMDRCVVQLLRDRPAARTSRERRSTAGARSRALCDLRWLDVLIALGRMQYRLESIAVSDYPSNTGWLPVPQARGTRSRRSSRKILFISPLKPR